MNGRNLQSIADQLQKTVITYVELDVLFCLINFYYIYIYIHHHHHHHVL